MNSHRFVIKGKLASFLFGPLLCLPAVPLNLFTLSIASSIGLTTILAVMGVAFRQPLTSLRNPFLNSLTYQWFFDPTVWHLVVGVLASVLIFGQAKYVRGADTWSRVVASGLPFALLVIVLLIGDFVIKPAYAIQRPLNPLPEPPLTAFFRHLLSKKPSEPDSMPSGFVMRQISLFYLVTWMIIRRNRSQKWVRTFVEALNILGLVIVAFSRVYRGAHSLLDVAAAIGIGTLLFWTIMLPPFSLISLRGFHINKVRLSTLLGGSIILFVIFLGFSNNGAALIRLFTYMLITIGSIYIVSPLIYLTGIRVIPRVHVASRSQAQDQ
jgi:membrane-associated phospholipid phosphatase